MNPKVIAGASGVASLALLGYLASRQGHSIQKRAIVMDDDDIEMDVANNTRFGKNAGEQWITFLRDIKLDVSDPDVFQKQASEVEQVDYKGNFANLRLYRKLHYQNIHDAMMAEHARRLGNGKDWAATHVVLPAAEFKAAPGTQGNCEFATSESNADEDGCVLRNGMAHTSPTVQALIDEHCPADYVPYTDDDNTNLWFIVPRAIPLWVKDSGSHVTDWIEYFTLIRRMATNWWERNHSGVVRLSIGLYLNGIQLIPRGVRMTKRSPLTRLTKWYSNPSLSAAAPGYYRSFKVLYDSMGKGAYVPNSGNGVLPGSAESKDNCFALMFFQDVPYDLNTAHIRVAPENSRKRSGDFIDKINSICHVNYAFVMPGARTPGTDAHSYINTMSLVLQPSLQQFHPYDPDYSTIYRLESFQEVSSTEFESHLRNAMCLHSKRQQCKLSMLGKTIDPTVAANYEEAYYSEYAEAAYDNPEGYEAYEAIEESEAYDYGDRSIDEVVEPAEPNPQCCGGGNFIGQFNAAIKTCVYDYDNEKLKVVRTDSLENY